MRKSSLNKEVSTFYNSIIFIQLLGPLLLPKKYGSLYPRRGKKEKNSLWMLFPTKQMLYVFPSMA